MGSSTSQNSTNRVPELSNGNVSPPSALYPGSGRNVVSSRRLRQVMLSSGLYVPSLIKKKKQSNSTTTLTHSLRNDVNMRRQSLRVASKYRGRYHVEFTFDAAVPCFVRVMWLCKEMLDSSKKATKRLDAVHSCRIRFEKGLSQRFDGSEYPDSMMSISSTDMPKLEYKKGSSSYPLLIVLEADLGQTASDSFDLSKTRNQITYVVLTENEDTLKAKILKQKVQVKGVSFDLYEIYGIKAGSADESNCVVCMTTKREVAVLPCRHMCLCSECAQELRVQSNKCPICRNVIKAYMQIKRETPPVPPSRGQVPTKEQDDGEDGEDGEAGEDVEVGED